MSVLTQIERIQQNITRSYSILESLGATMPSVRNSDNLPNTIASLLDMGSILVSSDGYILTDSNGLRLTVLEGGDS